MRWWALLGLALGATSAEAAEVPVRLLGTTYGSGGPRRPVVVRDDARYRRIWGRLGLEGPRPDVSFATSRVVIFHTRGWGVPATVPALEVDGDALLLASRILGQDGPDEPSDRRWVVEVPLSELPPEVRRVRVQERTRRLPIPPDAPRPTWLDPEPAARSPERGRLPAPEPGEVAWGTLPDGTALWIARSADGEVSVAEAWAVERGLPVPVFPVRAGYFRHRGPWGWDGAGASFDGVSAAPLARREARLDGDDVVVGDLAAPPARGPRDLEPWTSVAKGPDLPSEPGPWSALAEAPIGERLLVSATVARRARYGDWALCEGSSCDRGEGYDVLHQAVAGMDEFAALTGEWWVTRREGAPRLVEFRRFVAREDAAPVPARLDSLDACALLEGDGDLDGLRAAARLAPHTVGFVAWLLHAPCVRSATPDAIARGRLQDWWVRYVDAAGQERLRALRLARYPKAVSVDSVGAFVDELPPTAALPRP